MGKTRADNNSGKSQITSITKHKGPLLKEQDDIFKLLVESVNDYAIFTLDKNGYILSWNKGAERHLQYAKSEIIGTHFSRLFTPEDIAKKRPEKELKKAIYEGKTEDNNWVVRKDGTRFFATGVTTALLDKKGTLRGLAKLIRDLTELKHAEEEIEKGQEQLEIILENIADGISLQDAEGNVVYMNEVGAKLCGYSSAKEALSTSAFTQVRKKTLSRFEIRDEIGKSVPRKNLPGARALKGERNPQAVLEYYNEKTGKRYWSMVKSQAIFDDKGVVQGAVNIFSDITERLELEKRKDEFISMASHELKTPLTSLKVYTQLLQKYSDKAPRDHVNKMHKQIDKLTQLISELLDLSRIQLGKLEYHNEVFDLVQLVQEIVDNVKSTTKVHTFAIISLDPISLTADRDRIGQVVINLLMNAVKYSPQGDKIIVSLKKDKNDFVVSVKDFGIGIAKEHQSKIFERFYQVGDQKEHTYPGLGIGLFISNEIVKRHKGRLWVESERGKGTTFSFSLPINKSTVNSEI